MNTIPPIPPSSHVNRSEILYGVENAVGRVYTLCQILSKRWIFSLLIASHLDGVRGGIAINESEYMPTAVLQEAKPLTQVLYSNVKEIVEQG